jgi:flagellar hook-length control protein FliK
MPPALQGTASTGAAKATGTSPRSDASSGDTRRDFDALLNGDGASTAKAPTRPAGKAGNAGTADGSAKPGTEPNTPATADAPKRPGSDASTEAAADAGTTESTAAAKPAAQDSADDTEPAPWPPLGLAGLALAGTPPHLPPALQPAAPAATDADPLLATGGRRGRCRYRQRTGRRVGVARRCHGGRRPGTAQGRDRRPGRRRQW